MSIVEAARGKKVAQTARSIGQHPSTVWRWVTRGVIGPDGERIKLAATKFPGGWRIVDEDLERFIAALNQAQPEQPRQRVDDSTPRPESVRAERLLEASGW